MLNEVGSLDERRGTATKRQREEGNSVNTSFDEGMKSTSLVGVAVGAGNSMPLSEFPPESFNRPFTLPPPPDPTSIRMDEMGLSELMLFQMAYLTPHAGAHGFPEMNASTDRNIGGRGMVYGDGQAHVPPSSMNDDTVNSFWADIPPVFRYVLSVWHW